LLEVKNYLLTSNVLLYSLPGERRIYFAYYFKYTRILGRNFFIELDHSLLKNKVDSITMLNLLILSLEGFSASSRQMYPQLFPKILSRTAVHESITAEDALNYIGSDWPNIILVSDPAIMDETNRDLLEGIVNWVKHGCTMVCMGFFSSTIQHDIMNALFREHFGLKWRASTYTSYDVRLQRTVDETMIRKASLIPHFQAKAVYLGHVPTTELIYAGGPSGVAYAAFARVGLGKLGYIRDANFGEEPERLILAMCHLDRPEDSLEVTDY
jgi:hypothetical protein